ncbi:hypothetical protein Phi18:3_gp007 [Cellulophaga phage phi18:3]|uniref:Uncharacterized protein n=1 Tax=Cellulophaga phage phi18:3 TaxID=1327983 RepID=R9ZYT4_9CAUD|nr:hypothetical protein Phi18:3_gp007 [Cellulophaga phage phi18:3]AGO48519.1 hypothetical protein Phi18:3_gp007 [Cellulophaga phage phi18:3]
MANVKLIFQGTESTGTEDSELECYANSENEITLSIKDCVNEHNSAISLDVSTAIKFSKVLRSAINEVKN